LFTSAVYDHLVELQDEYKEAVRVYLHPTLAAGVVEGSFETDHETGLGDRKRIFRIWSEPSDPHAISRIERDLELEKRLKEGSIPSRPTKKARVEKPSAPNTSDGAADTAKKTHSKKKAATKSPTVAGATPAKPSAAAAKGTPQKTAAPKAAAASAKSTSANGSAKEAPSPNNPAAASAPPKPELVPPVVDKAKKSAPVAVETPNKVQGAKKVSASQGKKNAAASKEIVPNINDATETQDKSVEKRTQKEVSSENSTHNMLGFHPREIVLLAKAFDEELNEVDLKKKVVNKSTGKAAYSEKDVKLAIRILGGVDKEVKEMRAATADLEKSGSTKSDEATEAATTKATARESDDDSHENTTVPAQEGKTSEQKAGPQKSNSGTSSEAPSSTKEPPVKGKETDATTLKRKPGRPKGSKSKPKTTPEEEQEATTKASEGDKDDEVESKEKTGSETKKKNHEKASVAGKSSDQNAKPKTSDSNTSNASPKSSKKSPNAKDKEPEHSLTRKPGRPKGSKSKPEEEKATATTKTPMGDKDAEAESTKEKEKIIKPKTTKGIEETRKTPPAASEATTAKKPPVDSTTTDEEAHSETAEKRKAGRPKSAAKGKTAKTDSTSNKRESKTDEVESKTLKKKSSKRKRDRSEESAASSSPRTRRSKD
jgi:hypothetical protein